MSLTWFLYLINLSTNVTRMGTIFFITVSIVLSILSIGLLISLMDGNKKEVEKFLYIIKGPLVLFLILLIPLILLPDKKTLYMMLATYQVSKVMDNPKVQQVEDKVFKIINDKLGEIAQPTKEKQ